MYYGGFLVTMFYVCHYLLSMSFVTKYSEFIVCLRSTILFRLLKTKMSDHYILLVASRWYCSDLSCIIRYFWPLYEYNTVDRIIRFIIRSTQPTKMNISGIHRQLPGSITFFTRIRWQWNLYRSNGRRESFRLVPVLFRMGPSMWSYIDPKLTYQNVGVCRLVGLDCRTV